MGIMNEDDQQRPNSEDKPLSESGDQSDDTPLNGSQIATYRSSDSDANEDESDLFEITILSLTGTLFQVRVSPWETGEGLKNLLQRSQGIPACHQHLLYGNKELQYEESLIDQGIVHGATLKLILSLKGGPINTRRMSIPDDNLWREFSDFVHLNRDEIYECNADESNVTLLVLQEGDSINLYRVVENEDGSLSPLNDTWKSTSSGHEKTSKAFESHNIESSSLHDKLINLRSQMEALKISRKERKHQKELKSRHQIPKQKVTPQKQPTHVIQTQSHSGSLRLRSLGEENKSKKRRKSTGSKKSQYVPSFHDEKKNKRQYTSSTGRKIRSPKTNLSKGNMLDEIPGQLTPKHVEFSRHPKLESIKTRDRHYLGPLKEDSMVSPLPFNNRNVNACDTYAWHDENCLDKVGFTKERENMQRAREDLHRTNAPIPFYLDNNNSKRRKETDRLNKTQTENTLKGHEDFDDRPKTSPEILQNRPVSASTNSSFSEKIRLKTTDDKLKEIICILNSSRPTSPLTHRSSDAVTSILPINGQNGLFNTKSSRQSLKGSFSLSLTSYRGPHSPRAPSTSLTGANGRSEQRENRKVYVPSISQYTTSSKRSSPDIDIFRTPRSNRNKPPTPAFLPPMTKKKAKLPQKRCTECGKKLKVSLNFTCRCGLLFCAQHRYAETHDCSYDYKAQGKKFIELTNPLVMPPKLPKI